MSYPRKLIASWPVLRQLTGPDRLGLGAAVQSELARSCWKRVAPPLPKDVPRPGTVAECHMRAWFSTCTAPSAVYSFFMR